MTFDELFNKIQAGEISKEDAQKHFSLDWMETASRYILDVNRGMRTNIPEIIYGEYKSLEQTIELTTNILKEHPRVVISRSKFNNDLAEHFEYNHPVIKSDNVLVIGELPKAKGHILVVSAGAADHPVSEECEIILKAVGVNPIVFEDRGIAHPTRVLEAIKHGVEKNAKAVIVVAGMEGALAPFVASLVALPVIGVPTSVGYGFRAKEAALTSMLASCAPNLTVVNIDGGLRAAVVAALIAKNSAPCEAK
ncbi:nickel pincer cofactor biosynthesis protein LarB [Labilibacter marinus]|uniref:nickel pincer cofactor biosynthesis protein LarB n=1 Tax=Labilibacter marinus TaxID=1477105 RepID=UPI00082F8089|nr:nickel pincer cofactor biosynthesis protein LarB [Labilibacter marinus]